MIIKRVITDNDGVNIDSEDLAMRIMDDEGLALIRQYNPDTLNHLPRDHIYNAFPGTSTDKIVRALIEGDLRLPAGKNPDLGLPLALVSQDCGIDGASVEDVATHIADKITIATINRFSQELKSIPGTTQAWAHLSDQLGPENIALATTSRGDRMDVSVLHAVDPTTGENARLHEFFPEGQRRFSGYGGPNKYDAFFAQSGWDPAECAIIEDSLSGARYAKAGRPEVSVIGTVAARFYTDQKAHAAALIENGADIVISTMHDLPAAVQWINDGMTPEKKPEFAGKIYTPRADGSQPAPVAEAPLPPAV